MKLRRNADESKFTYNGQGIGFNGKVMWGYDHYFAGNIVIFGIDHTS